MPALKDAKHNVEDARFSRAAFGYKISEVDNFMDDIQRKMEEAIIEREEQLSLIENLRNKINTLQNEKDAVTRAILNSEKIAQASVIDAGVKSKYILKDASEKAARMINSANEEYEKKINEAKKLNDSMSIFVKECMQKFGTQMEALKSFNSIPISSIDAKNFQVDDIAKKFIEPDDSSTTQIFSDSTS